MKSYSHLIQPIYSPIYKVGLMLAFSFYSQLFHLLVVINKFAHTMLLLLIESYAIMIIAINVDVGARIRRSPRLHLCAYISPSLRQVGQVENMQMQIHLFYVNIKNNDIVHRSTSSLSINFDR
jgi:hypothetical protein